MVIEPHLPVHSMNTFMLVLEIEKSIKNNHGPDKDNEYQANKHGGRSEVLGGTRQLVPFFAVPIDNGFDRAVDQLDNKYDQADPCQQRDFQRCATQPEGHGYHDRRQGKLLPERGFMRKSMPEPLK